MMNEFKSMHLNWITAWEMFGRFSGFFFTNSFHLKALGILYQVSQSITILLHWLLLRTNLSFESYKNISNPPLICLLEQFLKNSFWWNFFYIPMQLFLKGTVSRDFLFTVFPQTAPPGPIREVLGPFWFFLLFHGVIWLLKWL